MGRRKGNVSNPTLHIAISPELREKLDSYKEKTGIRIATVVLTGIRLYFEREEKGMG